MAGTATLHPLPGGPVPTGATSLLLRTTLASRRGCPPVEDDVLPRRQRVEIPGPSGQRIVGRLDLPADPPLAHALFAHCFTCGKDLKFAAWLSRALVERRIGVLRFDFTGLGESGGEFADTNFSTNVADLVAAARHMHDAHGGPEVLIGHSLGGSAAIVAAGELPQVRAVVTVAAPSETGHLGDFLVKQTGPLGTDEAAPVDVLGRRVTVKGQMIEDFGRHDVRDAVAQLRRPLLILHAIDDPVVSVVHGERLFDAARQPKSFVALDGDDHLLVEREADARYVADLIGAWVGRYL